MLDREQESASWIESRRMQVGYRAVVCKLDGEKENAG
jgi:hypothetical protein